MKAVVLSGIKNSLPETIDALEIKDIIVPIPKHNQLLVKILASPCNPYDLAAIQGQVDSNIKLPIIPGMEGCGVVTETGNAPEAKKMLGKRVSFRRIDEQYGTWAEYSLTNPHNTVALCESIEDETGAVFFINFLTAAALIEKAVSDGAKAIIQTAAAGLIGHIIQKLGSNNHMKVINVVRKDSQVKLLKSSGFNYIINSNAEDFETALETLITNLKPTFFFDAVGGELFGSIFNKMPRNSRCIVHGHLSGHHICNLDTLELVFNNKEIEGFNLNDWLKQKEPEEVSKISDHLQRLISDGIIKPKIQAKFPLDEIKDGIIRYVARMSLGKVIFIPA